jgi:hypothetical protein
MRIIGIEKRRSIRPSAGYRLPDSPVPCQTCGNHSRLWQGQITSGEPNVLAGTPIQSWLLLGMCSGRPGMIDRRNRALRDYLLCARGLMEARSQVGGDSRRALSRS